VKKEKRKILVWDNGEISESAAEDVRGSDRAGIAGVTPVHTRDCLYAVAVGGAWE